jgi:YD repeat-containing protein
MNRRNFLATTLGLTLTSLAAGCQRLWTGDVGLAILAGSLPGQLVQGFQRQSSQTGQVSVVAKDSLLDLYRLLQTWQSERQASTPGASSNTPPRTAHWVTQADTWLAPAIQQGLIQALVDQDKRTLTFKYNEFAKPIEISDAKKGSVKFTYKNSGEVDRVESNGGANVSSEIMGMLRNLIDITSPAGVTMSI